MDTLSSSDVPDYQAEVQLLTEKYRSGEKDALTPGGLRKCLLMVRAVISLRECVLVMLRDRCITDIINEQHRHGPNKVKSDVKSKGDGRMRMMGTTGGRDGNGHNKRGMRHETDDPGQEIGNGSDTLVIRDALVSMVTEIPRIWAPLLLNWCVDVLRDFRPTNEKDLGAILLECSEGGTLQAVLQVLFSCLVEIDDLGLTDCYDD
eukprot:Ihof_evm3s203 gene=Ihof_evmTU3s203